jgi:hypothetical protein
VTPSQTDQVSKFVIEIPTDSAASDHDRHKEYCTISINSAGPVTRDGPAEILVSATSQSCRDMLKFLGNFRQVSAAGDEKF